MQRRNPTQGDVSSELFNWFPLGCPITLISVGTIVLISVLAIAQTGGRITALAPSVGPVMIVVGLIVLPFGIHTRLKRMRKVVLTGPKCGRESRTARTPFKVERWSDVPYAYITCSACGHDFMLDKYANLV